MTDQTNQCREHSGVKSCAQNLKIEVNDKVWPAIRKMGDDIKLGVKFDLFVKVACGCVLAAVFLFGLNRLSIADCKTDVCKMIQDDRESIRKNAVDIQKNQELFNRIDRQLDRMAAKMNLPPLKKSVQEHNVIDWER